MLETIVYIYQTDATAGNNFNKIERLRPNSSRLLIWWLQVQDELGGLQVSANLQYKDTDTRINFGTATGHYNNHDYMVQISSYKINGKVGIGTVTQSDDLIR